MVLLKTQPRGIHTGYIIKRYRGGVKTLFTLVLKRGGVAFFNWLILESKVY